MLKIALTGGIASGKSQAADFFAELGTPIVDSDQIARELRQPGQAAYQHILARFGPSILQTDQQLDRKKLRQLIFSDPANKSALEAILHPLIAANTHQLLSQLAADHAYAIAVIPLLIETNQAADFDRVLLIDSSESLQIERVMQRDQIDQPQAEAILANQASRKQRQQQADDIIENTGDLATLRGKIERLHQRYLAMAQQKSR